MKHLKKLLALLLALTLVCGLLPGAYAAGPAEPAEPNARKVAIDETTFPDANFRAFVKQYDTDSNGYLSTEELAAVIFMVCSNRNIANLKGIEHFTALIEFYCDDNQLSSLDVSKNVALEVFYCNNNQLHSLDLSKNTALTEFDCGNNQLTALNVSKNTALDMLSCHGNLLTSLDLSTVPALKDVVENGTKDTSDSAYDWYSSDMANLFVDKTVNIFTDSPVNYGLSIEGVEVTEANMNDVLDNGVFTFEPATNTLTIHDNYYAADDLAAIIDNYGCDGLVITTEGDVELASMNTTLRLSKDTTFTGGPLKVAAGGAFFLEPAVVVTDGAAVTLQDADLSLASLYDSSILNSNILKHVGDPNNLRDGFCVVEGGNWLIRNSSLHVSSADANGYNSRLPAILADHIALQNCYFADPDSPYNYAIDYRISDDGTRVLDAEGHNVTRLDILPGDPPEVLPSYGIYVDNQEVNGHNLTDVLDNGIFSFDGDHILSVAGDYKAHKYWYDPDPDYHYLSDHIVNVYYTMIENADCECLVIDLVQPSVFSNDLEYNYNNTGIPDTLVPGLKLSADTEITGAGLTMNWYAWQSEDGGPMGGPARSTVEVDAGVQLTIRNTSFTDVSDPNKVVYSLQGAEGSKLVVDRSAVTLSCGVSGFTGGISLVNCEIVEPEGGYVKDGAIVDADGNPACVVVIEPIENPFTDVAEGKYYYMPVLWAYNHDPQVTGGTDATHFGPNKNCTREQIVTFLWKAAGAPEPRTTSNPFTDVKSSKYYYKAVLWAVENNVTGGVSDTLFGVGRPCKREQAMTFLWKACGSPDPRTSESPFTDVSSSKYYYKAILWAVENKITGGVTATQFGVGRTCTRAQIVTFLYKALG